MPLLPRNEFLAMLRTPHEDKEEEQTLHTLPVILFFGERYLCRRSATAFEEYLAARETINCVRIDGDNEDPVATLARLHSYSLLPGRQLYLVSDSRLLHSRTVADTLWKKAAAAHDAGKVKLATRNLHALAGAAGLTITSPTPLSELSADRWKKLFGFEKPKEECTWADAILFQSRDEVKGSGESVSERYLESLKKGLPKKTLLLLTAETVDKRHRLFAWIKKNACAVDCTVAAGSNKAAQQAQKEVVREMMYTTLEEFGKKIDPRAIDLFLNRVGNHPVAVVMETEKLAHYVGDSPVITFDDLNTMVSRNREEALYELTEAIDDRDTATALDILDHLLERGVHSLAIVATLRSHLHRRLVLRVIQINSSGWQRGLSFREFSRNYLPPLLEKERFKPHLSGHPYPLYLRFLRAAEYTPSDLKLRLGLVLETEMKLKGSGLRGQLLLEELVLSMLKGGPRPRR